ncbi:MAG: CPBP family intramembrane metalloprotease [Clostridia bacterium]|nr:CPBP family intramembrane metalloprotease [Clostridia bacterium]
MSKTFKLSGIMLFSVMGLQISRMLFGLLPLSDNISGWIFSFVMQCGFLGVFPYLLYKANFKNDDFLKDIRVKKKISPWSYPMAIVIGLLTYGVNVGASGVWYIILTMLGFTYTRGGGVLFTSPEVLVFEIITSCVLPAIFEEITDRGLLLATLDDVKNDTLKVIAVGLFFGACHQNMPQLGPTAIAGVIIGFMAIKSGSILPGMIVHFMNNFIITIGSYVSQKNINLGIITAIDEFLFSNTLIAIGTGAACGIALIFLLREFMRLNQKYQNKDTKNDVEDSLAEIYGYHTHDAKGLPMYYTSLSSTKDNAPTVKTKKSDYALLIIAFISAMVVTIFTYIWGLLR